MNLNFKHQRSFSIGILILLGMLAVVFSFKKPFQQQPAQKYTVTLTVNEWQAVIGSITDPDSYSNNQRKEISNIITRNMIAVDTTKPKK